MAVKRSEAPVVNDEDENVDAAPAARTRKARATVQEEVVTDDEYFDDEDEDARPKRASTVQRGWGAAKKLEAEASDYTNEVKLSSDKETLLKFLEDDPFAVYKQHFIGSLPKGDKKSFVCLEDGCPLCDDLHDKPARKFAFSVANVTTGEPILQSFTVGPKLLGDVTTANEGKQGPLTKHLWSVVRKGEGLKTTYSFVKVTEAELVEDYDIDWSQIKAEVGNMTAYGPDIIQTSTKSELRKVVAVVEGDN